MADSRSAAGNVQDEPEAPCLTGEQRNDQRLSGSGQKNSGSQLEEASTGQRWDNLNIKKIMTIMDWQIYGYQRGKMGGGKDKLGVWD